MGNLHPEWLTSYDAPMYLSLRAEKTVSSVIENNFLPCNYLKVHQTNCIIFTNMLNLLHYHVIEHAS